MSNTNIRSEALQRLVDAAFARQGFHRDSALTLDRRYRRLAWFLSLYVPLASALLSALAATLAKGAVPISSESVSMWIAILGGTVTVATIVQATLKPEQKYVQYADMLIQLEDWRIRFEVALASMSHVQDSELISLVEERQKELSRLGQLMSQHQLPVRQQSP